jgi:Na+-translocating ferredoxin:NAD+ oxidoreductase RnfC subunit
MLIRIVETEVHAPCCGHIDQVYEHSVEDPSKATMMHGLLDSLD